MPDNKKQVLYCRSYRDFNMGLCTVRSQDRVWNASETGFATKYFLAEHLAEDP